MFELGVTYLWAGDKEYPSFYTDSSMKNREFAKNGFHMNYCNRGTKYMKGIVKPRYKSECKCVSVEPLAFDVSEIESPIVEGDIKSQHHDVVRKALTHFGCEVSDLGVKIVAETIIPSKFKDEFVNEQLVRQALVGYLIDGVGTPYSGSPSNYPNYMNRLETLLTAVFGSRLAFAIIKLNDTGDVRVEFKNNKFTAYYKDEELGRFLNEVESIVGYDARKKFMNAASLM